MDLKESKLKVQIIPKTKASLRCKKRQFVERNLSKMLSSPATGLCVGLHINRLKGKLCFGLSIQRWEMNMRKE